MSKIKIGDIVSCVNSNNSRFLYKSCVYRVVNITNDLIMVGGCDSWYDKNLFELIHPKFKNGDKVQVSDDCCLWENAVYVGKRKYDEDGRSHIVEIIKNKSYGAYCYCRHTEKEYTLKECADALGVPVEEFRIKEI